MRAHKVEAGVLVLAVLVLGACAVASDDNSVKEPVSAGVSAADASAVTERCLLPAVKACGFVTFDSDLEEATDFEKSMILRYTSEVGNEVPERQLTEAELRRLGVWRLPDGGSTFLHATISYVCGYEYKHNQLPASGAAFYPELGTPEGVADFKQLDDQTILDRYPEGIDPITGRFYGSFTAQEWTPGAMCVELVDDPAEVARLYPRLKLPIDSSDPDTAYKPVSRLWYVTVYGEAPGSVLYEGICWQ